MTPVPFFSCLPPPLTSRCRRHRFLRPPWRLTRRASPGSSVARVFGSCRTSRWRWYSQETLSHHSGASCARALICRVVDASRSISEFELFLTFWVRGAPAPSPILTRLAGELSAGPAVPGVVSGLCGAVLCALGVSPEVLAWSVPAIRREQVQTAVPVLSSEKQDAAPLTDDDGRQSRREV